MDLYYWLSKTKGYIRVLTKGQTGQVSAMLRRYSWVHRGKDDPGRRVYASWIERRLPYD